MTARDHVLSTYPASICLAHSNAGQITYKVWSNKRTTKAEMPGTGSNSDSAWADAARKMAKEVA